MNSPPSTDPFEFKHIDLEHDKLVPIQELCQARLGKTMSAATIWRWTSQGNRGGRLEAVRVNGRWYSTTAAFAAFLMGQTKAHLTNRTERDSTAMEDQLSAAGLL
ncbi:MAG: DUF1580 domain-containing protein [Planctomycetaceae bacterium]